MKTALIKTQKLSEQLASLKTRWDKDEQQASPRGRVNENFLLSHRHRQKAGKVGIRELFKDDKKDAMPIFSFASAHKEATNLELSRYNKPQKKVEFNIRNLISRSAHHVLPRAKRDLQSGRKTGRNFHIREGRSAKSIEELKHDFLNISEQLGLIANLKGNYREIAKTPAQPKRIKLYMNNLVKNRWQSNAPGDDWKEKVEKIRINPWEKSFETEEDNFLQN